MHQRFRTARLGALLATAAFAAVASPQGLEIPEVARPSAAMRASSPPVIDGKLADPCWAEAEKLEGFWDRQNGGLAADQTTFAVLYDEKYIYVAFWAKDSQPESVSARETTEDSRFLNGSMNNADLSEDHVDFRIDPYFTNQHSGNFIFSVNAIGTKSVRIAGGRASKREWKGDWLAAVERTPTGWNAEIAIPWEILNYPWTGKPTNFGFNGFRYQHRTRVQSCWSNLGPGYFYDRQGVWKGVSPPKPPTPKISLLPYVLPGIRDDEFTFRSGLDVRYPLSQELTAVASINPDFGTIEGAVESISFSRSERFIAEKRPFFLEGSGYVDLGGFFEVARFFYPRRIERFDLGTKLYGKLSPSDSIGLLHTVTFGDRNDVAMRYSRKFSPNGTADVFFGGKQADAEENGVGVVRVQDRFGPAQPKLLYARSGGNGRHGEAFQLDVGHDHGNNYAYLSYKSVSPQFEVADGLVFFTGYRGWSAYDWYGKVLPNGPIREYGFEADLTRWERTGGGRFQHSQFVQAHVVTDRDVRFEVARHWGKFESERDDFYSAGVLFGSSNRFEQCGATLEWGTLADEEYRFFGPRINKRFFGKLDIGYSGSFLELEGMDRQQILTMTYEISPIKSIGGRIVSRNGDTNGYLSYRHSGKKGTETFFIIGDPNADRFQRVAQLKFVFVL